MYVVQMIWIIHDLDHDLKYIQNMWSKKRKLCTFLYWEVHQIFVLVARGCTKRAANDDNGLWNIQSFSYLYIFLAMQIYYAMWKIKGCTLIYKKDMHIQENIKSQDDTNMTWTSLSLSNLTLVKRILFMPSMCQNCIMQGMLLVVTSFRIWLSFHGQALYLQQKGAYRRGHSISSVYSARMKFLHGIQEGLSQRRIITWQTLREFNQFVLEQRALYGTHNMRMISIVWVPLLVSIGRLWMWTTFSFVNNYKT